MMCQCSVCVTSVADAVGIVLVTDAISAMGLPSGVHRVGSQSVEVRNNCAVIAGTDTLCGRYCHSVLLSTPY